MHQAVEVLDAYNKINDALGLPENYENPDKMEELLKEQGDLQDKIEALGAWDIETKLNIAMDALRCPEPDTKISVLSGGEKKEESHYVVYCSKSLKFYYWMSLQTT